MTAYTRFRILLAEKEVRDERRWSLRDIRDATGIATSTLLRLSNNQAESIQFRVIDKLCDFFECETGDLIARRAG